MDLSKSLPSFIADLRDIEKKGGRLQGNSFADLSATLQSQQREPSRSSSSFTHSTASTQKSAQLGISTSRRDDRYVSINTLHDILTTSISASPSRTCLTFDEDDASTEAATTLIDIPALPQHIDQFKKQYEKLYDKRIKLPLIQQLSPRSRRKITQLPAPTSYDLARAAALEKLATKQDTPKLYSKLTNLSSKRHLEALRDGSAIPSLDTSINRILTQKSFHASETQPLATTSTNLYRSVEERKHRKKVQIENMASVDSVSLASGDESILHDTNTPNRPHSPDIYPFQTPLTEYLGHHSPTATLMRSDSMASNVSNITDAHCPPAATRRKPLTDIQKTYQPDRKSVV